MRVLVTGATGFVGGRIFSDLKWAGHEVTGTSTTIADDSNIVQLDVTDKESVSRLFAERSFDAVVHCAGIAHRFEKTTDEIYRQVNVEGTRNVASAARNAGVSRFVLMSSVLVYGGGGSDGEPRLESDVTNPGDSYARSKLDAELAAMEVFDRSKCDLLVLRPAPVIGEGSKGNFARLIRAIDRGRFIWLGTGSNKKSLTYVGDIASACKLLLFSEMENRVAVFNIASPPKTMANIVAAIALELNRDISAFRVPRVVASAAARIGNTIGGPPGSLARSIETWLSEDVYSSDALNAALPELHLTPIIEAVRRDVSGYLAKR